jgi:cytoskeletal protein CcmA (bactofilin family)
VGLFGKPEEKKPSPTPTSAPERTKAPTEPAAPATVVGRETRINGELLSSDNVRIEGRVEGKIKSNKQVVVGEQGHVQAEVEAVLISIRGKLEGDCSATDKVEVTATGRVYGNISAPRIAVAEGAIFRGSSRMAVEEKKPPRVQAPPGAKPEPATPEKAPLTTSPGTAQKVQ